MSASLATSAFPDPAVARWQGLAIGVEERDGRFLYRVRMVHDEAINGATIVQTEDENEAVVAWRYWSASLRLPRLIEKALASISRWKPALARCWCVHARRAAAVRRFSADVRAAPRPARSGAWTVSPFTPASARSSPAIEAQARATRTW